MKKLYSLCLLALVCNASQAQYTLYKSKSYIEISGYLTSYYNYRFYPSTETDKRKNRFALDYAVFKMDGTVNKIWNYQLQLNAAALADPTTSDGFIMQASAAYNALKDNLQIELGYDKLPFSRSSMVANTESPFLQRPEIARGGAFSRRDIGTTITYSLLNKKINLYAGAYTGLGPQSLAGENDPSGKLEYIARAEFSYPARYRHAEVDLSHIHIPLVSVGINGRYAEKKLTSGVDYPILTLDGKKLSYGADLSFAFKGFSLHLESIQLQMTPRDSTLLLGKPTDYFLAGGIIAHANYYIAPLKSVIAIRYDEFNPNDLVAGDNASTLSFGYNYLFDGMRSALKIHYMKRIKDDKANKVWTDDQLRIALQLMF